MRIAVWGCGWAGSSHAAAFAQAGAEVAWCIDRDAQRAADLAGRYGGRSAAEFDDVRADSTIRAVSICLPHAAHAQAVIQAAGAGLHILCEKPLAPALDQADAAIGAARRAGVTLQVVDNLAHDPAFARIGEHLGTGAIGRVALAEIHREADLAESFRSGRGGFLEPGGGILLSGAVHDIGTVRRLLGEVSAVEALAPSNRIPEMSDEDTAAVLLRLADGAVVVLIESFVTPAPEVAAGAEIHTLRLVGSEGTLEFDTCRTLRLADRTGRRDEAIPEADTYFALVRDFVRQVESGTPSVAQATEHRRTLAVALAARRSARTIRPAI